MNFGKIWRWIDNDLNQAHPWSLMLILLPFLPFGAAIGFGAAAGSTDTMLALGMIVAAPWFFYAFVWRGMRRVMRSTNDSISSFRRKSDRLD
ncbi:hypothetical protein FHW96_004343 [Novosphingobium sp. SG751A]|uniref:hypothetical protein n=1 Tax=Novosphingobium sp. SG751A TaxID=2587000 RepID=UPI0015534C42|nr:hypothetical protein [Novosphingobium sp. SG751A]NOW48159.1 hypothetical protein [Novosphingobium sp. SG751A]